MADKPQFKPFIRPDESVAEFTLKAVVLGVILSAVLTAANVYLGLMAGMTVCASIPAAVISMGILRGILKRGTILENNMVQTMSSAGESIAAGIIFTIPALVIAGIWSEYKFWPTFLVGVLGGVLGILFMIPLRRALIVEEKELTYPEGVACAEILETGQKGGTGVKYLFGAIGFGVVYALLRDFGVLAGKLATAFRIKKAVFSFGSYTSTALLAVGYIIGPNIAILVFVGGLITWFVAVPIYMAVTNDIAVVKMLAAPTSESIMKAADTIWRQYIRYMGVGAMVIGGFWSIWRMRRSILAGLAEVARSFRGKKGTGDLKRTEKDMPMSLVMPLLGIVAVTIFFLYWHFTGAIFTALICAAAMIVAGFFFVAVSSYITGLVGSSNNPVSGMILFTLLFASGLLLLFGVTGQAGILAALIVAGVVCCAACAAGDMSQDLKTGHLVGATPAKMQIGQIIGVVVASAVTAPVLMLLHKSRGIGVEASAAHPMPLEAPQAGIFSDLTKAVFKYDVPWMMLTMGAAFAVALIILDEIARIRKSSFRLHVMPVAIGIYLPFALTVPILIGGIIRGVFGRKISGAANRGILIASGLIAGEAITGIIVAAVTFIGITTGALKNFFGAVVFIMAAALLAVFAKPKADDTTADNQDSQADSEKE
ncbi:MAG: oligopeptide transporter, OPT family [Planctomycetota bacterium]|nr:MAG: oligopeptide transporter, OPT family [Planctomycetota bacterium]